MPAQTRTVAAAVSRTGQHLAALRSRYPDAVDLLDRFRKGRGSAKLGTWPAWCWVPMAGAYAVASDGGPALPDPSALGRIAAVSTWRLGRGVYRVDPDLYAALIETPLDDQLPIELLYRLPEWCVYLDLPGDDGMAGCYVHLEHDLNNGRPELRLLVDTDGGWEGLLPVPIILDRPTIAEGLAELANEPRAWLSAGGTGPRAWMARIAREHMPDVPPETLAEGLLGGFVGRVLSTVLYLVTTSAEISDPARPSERPAMPRADTGRGARQSRLWEVGYRIGAALRAAETGARGAGAAAGDRQSPRPHVRRAHWHHYWIGPRTAQTLALRWLPPVLVAGLDPDDLTTTVHEVETE